MRLSVVCLILGLHVGLAQAELARGKSLVPAKGSRQGLKEFRGYVPITPSEGRTVLRALQTTRLIYLNGCFDGGCAVSPGFESSIDNRSAIIGNTIQLSPFQWGEEKWRQVVDCVRETYAPFDVIITDQDPSPMPHFEAMVAGVPAEAGFQPGIAGVAPFDKGACGVIDNAISYSFANALGGSVNEICWTAAQEIAHTFGLDHEFLCEDPMTYLNSCSNRKMFQNKTVRCGEFEERDCECGKPTQNSLVGIMQVFGPRDKTPPAITIVEPVGGAEVTPGFLVRAKIEETIAIGTLRLLINGKQVAEVLEPDEDIVTLEAPATLKNGPMTIEVRATDIFGAKALAQVLVTQIPDPATSSSGGCSSGGTLVASVVFVVFALACVSRRRRVRRL
jgi:hypothetical protein